MYVKHLTQSLISIALLLLPAAKFYCFLSGGLLQVLYMCSLLNLRSALLLCLLYTVEKTEAQRNEVTCFRSHSSEVVEQGQESKLV